MEIPLNTINSQVAIDICADECEAKCCDFYLNDFYARVNIEDYKKLKRANLERFVIWDHGPPQLAKQPGGKCIFLNPENNQCSIYPIRPLDCRNFPFAMEEEQVPDHCLLFKRSSYELKLREKEKTQPNTISVPKNNITDIEKEYITRSEGKLSLSHVFQEFQQEVIFETSNGLYSIIFDQENQIEQAEEFIDNFEEADIEEFVVLSLIGINDDFEYTFHLNGIFRNNENVDIPIIDKFPPSSEDLNLLVQWANTKSYQHLYSGYILKQAVYDRIQHNANNIVPNL